MNIQEAILSYQDFQFFWGGTFSQWHLIDMHVDGIKYNCCEQYMMHQKALLFKDMIQADVIMRNNNPRRQKYLGRNVN